MRLRRTTASVDGGEMACVRAPSRGEDRSRRSRAGATRASAAAGSWLTLVVGTAAALPVIVSTMYAVRVGWEPTDDKGIIATRAYDVLTAHTPLVGQYTNASLITGRPTHGLGPMLYWLIALPARIGSPVTMAVSMGVVNTLAVVGTVALARRRGGLVLMFATALATVVMCTSLAGESFHDIWNPAAPLFPFLLLMFVCWSLACGEYRLLPIAVLAASFVAQAHLSYTAPALGMLAVAVAGLWMRAPRGRSLARWILAAALVGLACWLPTIIDQLSSQPGNLSLVARSATAHVTTLGPRVGARAVMHAIGWRPWWLIIPATRWDRYNDVLAQTTLLRLATTIVLLAALAVLALLGWRRERWDLAAAALIGLVLCLTLGAVAAHTPVRPVLASTVGYTLWWASQCGMWVWLILGWAGWLAVARRVHPGLPGRWVPAVTLIAVAVVAIAGAGAAATEKPDQHVALYRPLARIARRLDQVIPRGKTVRLEARLDGRTQPFKAAVRYFLARRRIRVLSEGASPRNGSWYEYYHRPFQLALDLTDKRRPPRPGASLLIGVGFREAGAGHSVFAWISPAPRRRAATRAPAGR
jgi:hypothetical protein